MCLDILLHLEFFVCSFFFFSSRRRHTRSLCDWSSDVCSSDLVVDSLVEEVDVMPTLLELLGVSPPAGVQGKSLVPLAKNPKARHKDAVFSEFPTIKMARTREWKLVHYTRAKYGELYHLTEDPHELTNLWDDSKYAVNRADMEGRLFDWLSASADPLLSPVKAEDEK